MQVAVYQAVARRGDVARASGHPVAGIAFRGAPVAGGPASGNPHYIFFYSVLPYAPLIIYFFIHHTQTRPPHQPVNDFPKNEGGGGVYIRGIHLPRKPLKNPYERIDREMSVKQ